MQKKKFSFHKKNWFQEILILIWCAIAVFWASALGSYHPKDLFWIQKDPLQIQNVFGTVGVWGASFWYDLFGLGSWGWFLGFCFCGVGLFLWNRSLKVFWAGVAFILSALWIDLLLAIHWPSFQWQGEVFLTGGYFGYLVSKIFVAWFQKTGATVFFLFALLGTLLTTTSWSLLQSLERVQNIFKMGLNWSYRVMRWGWMSVWGMVPKRKGFLSLLWKNSFWEKKMSFFKRKSQKVKTLFTQSISYLLPFKKHLSSQIKAPEDQKVAALEKVEPSVESTDAHTKVPVLETQHMHVPASRKGMFQKRNGLWKFPLVEFLKKPPTSSSGLSFDKKALLEKANILKQKLLDFGIQGEVTAIRPGPIINLFEFKPGPGIKLSKISALADDLSMALASQNIRILAPLPGKNVVGIEVPSEKRQMVYLREAIEHASFLKSEFQIPVILGKDLLGQMAASDLAQMPHLLIAGQTGAGKSVFMNSLICSFLYRFTPDQLRMILVDPKFIEFRSYQDVPHLLLPIVDDPQSASIALKWAVREMERRYRILAMLGVRNLHAFHKKAQQLGPALEDVLFDADKKLSSSKGQGEDWLQAFEKDEDGQVQIGKLPFIVVIIDELADLMMTAKKDVELSVARLSQKARAAGIHLVLATQRPSTDVITGLIKANLPTRLSFQLASFVDSKIILDRGGAERLLGKGDLLFLFPGGSYPVRFHGAYVDDEEIQKITAFWKSQAMPTYREEILVEPEETVAEENFQDKLFQEAVKIIRCHGHASASFLQRHLKIGYNRAARMIEHMEKQGMVGPAEGSRPREVFLS